ncbi:MAG TPA: DUF3306 domain-containing protein [Xanthobacteraceae bacterium]|jgi:hypothetical protein|nr:DUF3306 domain-containing protein [Xanthobacteraceae bacterium]
MSENEAFLTRWSRRKREAIKSADVPDPVSQIEAMDPKPDWEKNSKAPQSIDATPVELSSLPSIETIDAKSNVGAFLSRGIPQDLTTAALRRAWIADPSIRDFVGPSENAWDFNAPDLPGFGSLTSDDIAQVALEWVKQDAPIEQSSKNAHSNTYAGALRDDSSNVTADFNQTNDDAFAKHDAEQKEEPHAVLPRHGRALPR